MSSILPIPRRALHDRWRGARRACVALVLAICTFAASPGLPASSAATIVAKPGGVAAALATAQPGDTIQLRAGTYIDKVTVPSFTGEVTIAPYPAEAPILKDVAFTGGRHLRVERLRLQRLVVTGTADLTLASDDFTISGVFLRGTDRVRFTSNRLHDAFDGLVVSDSTGILIDRNEFWNIPVPSRPQSGDCIQMKRVHDFRITGNVFRDQPIKPHVDAIEIVNTNTDGLIDCNRFRNVRGLIFTPGDNTPSAMQYRMTIVNNLFAHTREFAFNGVRMHDSQFVFNTAPDGGFVQFGGASSGNVVVGNIMRDFRVDPARMSLYLSREDYNLVGTYRAGMKRGVHDIVGAATFVNAAAGDFHLTPTSKGVNAACAEFMPATDIDGTARMTHDMGAFAGH
jgi:hypothetical protein